MIRISNSISKKLGSIVCKVTCVFLVSSVWLNCFGAQLFADGAMVYYVEEGISSEAESAAIGEHSQRAFLFFDQNEQIERLVFWVKTDEFQGRFAWIVPIPPVPEGALESAAKVKELQNSSTVFLLLDQLTSPSVTMTKHFIAEAWDYMNSTTSFGCAWAYPDIALGKNGDFEEIDATKVTGDLPVELSKLGTRDAMELTLYVYSPQLMTIYDPVIDRLVSAHVYPDAISPTALTIDYHYLIHVALDTDKLLDGF